MNMSDIISDLKMDTGLAFISLPIDNFDQRIEELVIKRTLKTFNQFFPERVVEHVDLRQLRCIKESYDKSTYELDNIRGRDIMSIDDVTIDFKSYGGVTYDPIGDISLGTYGDMMMAQASANLVSMAAPPFTFEFEQRARLLSLYNVSTIGFEVRITALVGHTKNLASIKDTQEESFYELALLDFKRFMYANLKYFDKIDTVHGTIDLKIEEYSNAEQDRKELISEWRQKYHLDRTPLYYI